MMHGHTYIKLMYFVQSTTYLLSLY